MAANPAPIPEVQLIRGGIVVPMAGGRVLHDPGSVLVDGDTIVAVGPAAAVDAHPRAIDARVHDATGHAVIPGLHNCHLHSGLLRGTAESLSLWDWLRTYIDPMHRALTPEIAEAASELAYAEAAKAGTVSLMDMWRFMDGSARAADALGIRATLVPYVADLPGYEHFETTESNLALLESVGRAAGDRVRAWVGLEHLFYCSPDAFAGAVSMAERFDAGIHIHSSETRSEVDECTERFGRRPIEELHHRGVLGPRTVVAHGVWLDDREIDLLARTGTSIAHCPCSNMKLASGVAPVGRLRAAGVDVGLGTDGEKENNTLDLLSEMKFASLLQKVSTLDATTGDPWDILDMATRTGARVLGLGDVSGTLEAGKRADIVTVDLRRPHTTPLLHGDDSNVVAHLVFSALGHDVSGVWVDGRQIVTGGELVTVDEGRILARAQAAAEELFARRRAVTG